MSIYIDKNLIKILRLPIKFKPLFYIVILYFTRFQRILPAQSPKPVIHPEKRFPKIIEEKMHQKTFGVEDVAQKFRLRVTSHAYFSKCFREEFGIPLKESVKG